MQRINLTNARENPREEIVPLENLPRNAEALPLEDGSCDKVLSISVFQFVEHPERAFRIVNIGSVSAYASSPSRGEYCISKAGVRMMTRLYADRLGEHNIVVIEVSPGLIETDMTSAVKDKYDKIIDEGLTPIKRWGQVEDVARAVGAIAEGKLDFSTGNAIDVDGGFHLKRL